MDTEIKALLPDESYLPHKRFVVLLDARLYINLLSRLTLPGEIEKPTPRKHRCAELTRHYPFVQKPECVENCAFA